MAVSLRVKAAQKTIKPFGIGRCSHFLDRVVPDRRRRQILADGLQHLRKSQGDFGSFPFPLMSVDTLADYSEDTDSTYDH